MTIEEYLQSTYKDRLWKDIKKYNEAVADATKLSPDAWNNKWSNYLISNKYLVDSYVKSRINETSKPLPVRLRNYFGDDKFNPDDNKRNYIRQSFFSDVPKDEFNRVLDQMKANYDYEVKLREDEAGKIRRQREIEGKLTGDDKEKNWGFIHNLLASDYAKERYINEPETSIFGAEAPDIGKAPNTRIGAALDLGSGAAGAVADFIPPIWWAGPVIRTSRDFAYYGSDSPYSKDLKDIGISAGLDFGINRMARMMPNARREANIARRNLTNEASRTLNAETMMTNISKDLSKINGEVLTNANDAALANIIADMSESPMKEELVNIVKQSNISTPINRDAISKVLANYQGQTSQPVQDFARMLRRGEATPTPSQSNYYSQAKALNKVADTKAFKELGIKDKGSYLWNKLVNEVNKGNIGQIFIQESAHIPGRSAGTIMFDNSEEFDRAKNAFRAQNEVNWERFGKSFKPDKIEGSPAWAAYEEWYFDKYGKLPEDK